MLEINENVARKVLSIVDRGLSSGLQIIKKVATPGDYRPDLYVLQQAGTGRIYSFTPHYGLSRCDSIAEASAW